jgi:PAS domain S-box-containing protein
MALTTTPELLRELATLYKRIDELEQAGGLKPGEGAPEESAREVQDLLAGLHTVVATFADDIIGIVTPAGDIVHMNAAVERVIGFRPEEVIGKNAWSFVNEEDLASLASARSAPLDDAIPIEVRVRCADGREKWLEFSARPWPKDAPRYIVARWRDAEARRDPASRTPGEVRLAEELRRAAALARISQLALGLPQVQDVLDAAASLAPAALGLPSGAYLEAGEAGLKVRADAGFPAGVRGQAISPVMTLAGLVRAGGAPERSPDLGRDSRLADPLLQAAGAGSALAVPVRGKERLHGVLLVAGRAPRYFAPEEVHFLETVANVVATAVDFREAQEALRGRERLARAVFDHARDGMAIVDDEGRCVDANAAAERILGANFEALRGRRPAEVVRTDVDLSARATPRQRVEGTVATPSGNRAVEWDLVPGILPGLGLAVLRDVTELREVQTRVALADRLISVGTLAAGVAHELNTPLAYVTTNLEYLAGAVPPALPADLSAEVSAALRESIEGTERLRLIIEDLRTFVRTPGADAGPADLEAVLRSCIGMTWNEIRHRARLERDVAPLPPVAGNPARLAQVFVNLLVNAAQSIRVGNAESNLIRVAARAQPDGRVAVEVTDTGAGIPPNVLPRIFEPFFTTKPATAGTGLGLSICRSIVQGLGGEIEVKSAPGAGTTFRVRLPIADLARSSIPATEPVAVHGIPRSRILVVDDERLVGAALKRALGGEHDVTVVASPRMALRLLEQGERYDAVLCDLLMPDLTGLELHAAIVRHAPQLAGRVIFMTAGALTEETRRTLDAEAAPCLSKPLKQEALRGALAQVLARS